MEVEELESLLGPDDSVRVDSEETQDNATEAKDLDQEKAEKISFVLERDQRSAKALFFVVTIGAVKRPSVSGSLRRW